MVIKYRLDDSTIKGETFFRSLENDYPQLDWHDTAKKSYNMKCHWGQKKLLFSEIEFLSLIAKHHSLNKFLVVYVGSANGIHINLFKEMFPELQWLLYDGAPFQIPPHKNFIIKTGNEGFFTDDTVVEVLKIANGREIIFISDIRLDPKEDLIYNDMLSQQRWAIMLNAQAIMLKMRLPFTYSNQGERSIDPSIRDRLDETRYDKKIQDKIIVPSEKGQSNDVLYLDGKIQFQIYAPSFSIETRLITFPTNGKYQMKYYNAYLYESQMLYFNEIDRAKMTFKYHDSHKVKDHIIGFDDGYDSTAEYIIVEQYLTNYKKVQPTFDLVVKELYYIDYSLRKLTKRSLIDCNKITVNKYLKFDKPSSFERKVILKDIQKYQNMISNSLKEQKEKIKYWIQSNKGILSNKQYQEQLQYYS